MNTYLIIFKNGDTVINEQGSLFDLKAWLNREKLSETFIVAIFINPYTKNPDKERVIFGTQYQ